MPKHGIVRPPGKTYAQALTRLEPAPKVDVELARAQHRGYVAALSGLGIDVFALPADDAHPDAVFVQDRVAVIGGRAIVGPTAVPARAGEAEPLVAVLSKSYPVVELRPPAFLDWGDVLITEDALFVGLSERSNGAAVEQLREMLAPQWSVEGVALPADLLHLLSGCASLGEGALLVVDSLAPFARARGFQTVPVAPAEALSANVLAVGHDVIVPAGYPETAAAIGRTGRRVHAVAVSEFEKRDGGVTCLSILY